MDKEKVTLLNVQLEIIMYAPIFLDIAFVPTFQYDFIVSCISID